MAFNVTEIRHCFYSRSSFVSPLRSSGGIYVLKMEKFRMVHDMRQTDIFLRHWRS
ncbi:hypothetical protein Mapa_017113 [Marchantia paleacea]|nr:hypothetical protein Mapa_017113 [Marchantia paleacea]